VIELPTTAIPGSFTGTLIDAGFIQRAAQSADYIARKGSRYRVGFTYRPRTLDERRVMVARLIAAKQSAIRVALPLLQPQGSPGTPVVASASGRTLALSGLTPGYAILEGYWLSIVKSGQHFLHNIRTGATADGGGLASVELNELLRDTFAVGATVNLAVPRVEGLLIGDEWSWQFAPDLIVDIEFAIEERK
jgi:hypothetical protein